jgi:EF hand
MKLIVIAVAAAFAIPVHATGDKAKDASATPNKSESQSASQGASNTGNKGADAMFNSLDKNKDGMLTREEAKGTPHDKDFATLDKNNDGKLSPQEHAAAPEHADKSKAASGATAQPKAESKTEGKPKY